MYTYVRIAGKGDSLMMDVEEQTEGKKKTVHFYPEEWKWLEALADANTGGNQSMLLRKLLQRAYESPKRFGFHPPAQDR